ncbi:unnamed protein product [Clonostachys byssicola]|uniref:Uncharacterized protein n=1 Tax=Clonostachys byssicola TaxID=160290 RepID=A0A9N9UG62_9HYPO|nr:unnamed protein product [Clonostachys byssicola]
MEPDAAIVCVSAEMIGLVVEALLLRDRIIDSGTSLVWKVVYYGLSAAGILCLALLRTPFVFTEEQVDASQVVKDLTVLVAVVEKGSLVDSDDANYALLAGAAQAIEIVLQRIDMASIHQNRPLRPTTEYPDVTSSLETLDGSWESLGFNYFQDLQNPFWQTIAEGHFDPNGMPEMLAQYGS